MVRQYLIIDSYCLCVLYVRIYRLTKDKGTMVLGRDQYYSIDTCEEKDSIQLSLILLSGGRHSADQRIELLQYFQCKLEMVMEDFMQASTKPVAYIPCCYCDELHVELRYLIERQQQHCASVGKPLPDEHYLDLITNKSMLSFSKQTLITIFKSF